MSSLRKKIVLYAGSLETLTLVRVKTLEEMRFGLRVKIVKPVLERQDLTYQERKNKWLFVKVVSF
jgi:hypothetical protein